MNLMHQFRLLSEFLKKEDVVDGYPIHFREESEADNRYALSVGVHPRNGHPELLRKLAAFFGCPERELPDEGEDSFEASDHWHGRGAGNLRELADEMTIDLREGFFDVDYTAGDIHALGAAPKVDPPSLELELAESIVALQRLQILALRDSLQVSAAEVSEVRRPLTPFKQLPVSVREQVIRIRKERWGIE
jgi:hypothetical protein